LKSGWPIGILFLINGDSWNTAMDLHLGESYSPARI